LNLLLLQIVDVLHPGRANVSKVMMGAFALIARMNGRVNCVGND
jgi:hypothetical protein